MFYNIEGHYFNKLIGHLLIILEYSYKQDGNINSIIWTFDKFLLVAYQTYILNT